MAKRDTRYTRLSELDISQRHDIIESVIGSEALGWLLYAVEDVRASGYGSIEIEVADGHIRFIRPKISYSIKRNK
jgi:hypothetical protein